MTLCAVTVAPRCWKMWHLEHWQVHRWVPDDQQSLTHVLPPPPHTHTHTHTLLDKVVVSLVSSPALQMAQAVMLPSFQQRYQTITVIVRGGEGGREGGREGREYLGRRTQLSNITLRNIAFFPPLRRAV